MHGLDLVNTVIFVGAALVLTGIFSSLVATRIGAPLLLVFLVVGMLAGQDGPGGIIFNNYSVTYLVGSIALAVILFDGGLRTRLAVFRGVLAPSLLLATFGVLITASVAGLAAWSVLDLDPEGALLLGAIVASTDAAAVFFLLRTGGLRLTSRVGSTLEIESGTNDPIAVFLVIVLTEYILAGGGVPGWGLALRLAMQALVGGIFGLGGRLCAGGGAEPAGDAGRAAPAVRGGGRDPDLGDRRAGRRQRTAGGLHRRTGDGEPTGAGLSLDRRLPRRGDLALPDRDVPGAGPAGHADHALGLRAARHPGGPGPDLRGAAAGGLDLPRPLRVRPKREGVHLLGGPAWRGVDLPRGDPDAGRGAERPGLLQHRVLRGAVLDAGSGLDADHGGEAAGGGAAADDAQGQPGRDSTFPARPNRRSSAIR